MSEVINQTVEPIREMLERLNVNAVFGQPIQEGDTTIIPVAEIRALLGYGCGFGVNPSGKEGVGANEGGGGGGGARGRAMPRGYVRITPEGVTFEPITDQTRIPLAGIALSAWTVFWVSKTIRSVISLFAKKKK
jgi:uncharacterized spore protein YtfJ